MQPRGSHSIHTSVSRVKALRSEKKSSDGGKAAEAKTQSMKAGTAAGGTRARLFAMDESQGDAWTESSGTADAMLDLRPQSGKENSEYRRGAFTVALFDSEDRDIRSKFQTPPHQLGPGSPYLAEQAHWAHQIQSRPIGWCKNPL